MKNFKGWEMSEFFAQIMKNWSLLPVSENDLEELKNFKINQIIRIKASGTNRPRSVRQNRWIHNMFKITAENNDDPEWATPEMVKRNVKMALKFFKNDVVVSGNKVYFELRSFAFHKMRQVEADRVFNEALEICSQKTGIPVEELEPKSKE